MDERLQRLEGDKDSLQMQVSILMDQIEAQTDKIADLERTLSDRAFQLQKSEENLQKVITIYDFSNYILYSTVNLNVMLEYLCRNYCHVLRLKLVNSNC